MKALIYSYSKIDPYSIGRGRLRALILMAGSSHHVNTNIDL
jgi:hypothetical protein